MDELLILPDEEPVGQGDHSAEFFIATVGDLTSDGITLIFDGATEPTTKRFKSIANGRGSASAGQRVVVMKQSGTYIVLGALTKGQLYTNVNKLASGATLATTISRFNSLLTALVNKGIINSNGTS